MLHLPLRGVRPAPGVGRTGLRASAWPLGRWSRSRAPRPARTGPSRRAPRARALERARGILSARGRGCFLRGARFEAPMFVTDQDCYVARCSGGQHRGAVSRAPGAAAGVTLALNGISVARRASAKVSTGGHVFAVPFALALLTPVHLRCISVGRVPSARSVPSARVQAPPGPGRTSPCRAHPAGTSSEPDPARLCPARGLGGR